jgi:hypothetical protein
VPIATQVPKTEIVGEDDDDVWFRRRIGEIRATWETGPDGQYSHGRN